jgi:hypothetical protein
VEETVKSTAAEIVIGRVGDARLDIDLSPDLGVSRRHARLFRNQAEWLVEDLGSRNGTLLDGRPVTVPTPVTPGSVLHVGANVIRIHFSLIGVDLQTEEGPGSIAADVLSHETVPPAGMREDDLLSVLARLQEVVGYARNQVDMLDGSLRELRDAFRAAERASIVMVEKGELIVRAFWPRPAAATSFTLARRAIDSEHALLWRRSPGTAESSPSLTATASALYAPMLRAGRAVGAVHLDTVSTTTAFASGDLPRFGVMANIIGAAIDVPTAASFPRLPGIFVSYAHVDGDFVRQLVGDLRRRQIRVWFDERLRSGEVWHQQLRAAIGAADAFLLVLSPASVTSEYVQWEIGVAKDLSRLVVPVVYQRCQRPEAVRELQSINLAKDYAAGLLNLKERLMPLTKRAT